MQTDICSKLPWLKKVKESKGSMEMNAYKQVEIINNQGMYHVGCLNKDDQQGVEVHNHTACQKHTCHVDGHVTLSIASL